MSEIPNRKSSDAWEGSTRRNQSETQWKSPLDAGGRRDIREKKNKKREVVPTLDRITLSREQNEDTPVRNLGDEFYGAYLPEEDCFIVGTKDSKTHLVIARPDKQLPPDPLKLFPQ